jgi:hypothetical protein
MEAKELACCPIRSEPIGGNKELLERFDVIEGFSPRYFQYLSQIIGSVKRKVPFG